LAQKAGSSSRWAPKAAICMQCSAMVCGHVLSLGWLSGHRPLNILLCVLVSAVLEGHGLPSYGKTRSHTSVDAESSESVGQARQVLIQKQSSTHSPHRKHRTKILLSSKSRSAPRMPQARRGGATAIEQLLADYDPQEPPVVGDIGTVRVAMGFQANKLLLMDQAEQTVTWAGWIRRYWYDPRLVYDGDLINSLNSPAPAPSPGPAPAGLSAPSPGFQGSPSASKERGKESSLLYEGQQQQQKQQQQDEKQNGELGLDDDDEPQQNGDQNEKQELKFVPASRVPQDRQAWSSETDFLSADATRIWTPDITVVNAVDFNWQELCEQTEAFIYDGQGETTVRSKDHDGKETRFKYNVLYSQPCVVKVKCDINLKWFPFDTNNCPIIFEPWADNFLDLIVGVESVESYVSIPEFVVSVGQSETSRKPYRARSKTTWPRVQVWMQITRHGHYYVVNFICPMLLMVMLSWISFWIPWAASDRIQFMVTVVLTVMAVNFITAEKRPAYKEDMWLDLFQTRTLLLVVLTTFFTVWLRRFEPAEDWMEEEKEKRRLALDFVEHIVRVVYPVIILVVLGSLFYQLFGYINDGPGISDRQDFTGASTMSVVISLGLMVFLLILSELYSLEEVVHTHVERLEDWRHSVVSESPAATRQKARKKSRTPDMPGIEEVPDIPDDADDDKKSRKDEKDQQDKDQRIP